MKESSHVVHAALALHLSVDARAIESSQRIAADLGLDAFDLVLVALRFEETAPARGEFPMELLESVRTVRELTALYEAWLDGDTMTDEERSTSTLVTAFAAKATAVAANDVDDATARESFA